MKPFKQIIEEAAGGSELASSLRAMIQSIYEMETEGLPEGEDPAEVAEVGLDLLSNFADRLPDDVIGDIMQSLAEYYDMDVDYDDAEGEEEGTDEAIEAETDAIVEALINERQTSKQHKLLKIKAKKKAALGDKADSMDFKRKYFFDTKLKKFVKRDKALSVSTIKKKAKLFKKILKKASTRLQAAKTKKKFGEAA